MSKKIDEIFNPEIIDLEEWNDLISHPHFSKLISFINMRIVKHAKDADKLALEPSLDNNTKVTALLNRKDELNGLLRKFNSYVERKKEFDLKKQQGD